MYLQYYRQLPNFGDALNPLLAERVFGDIFSDDETRKVLFIGTIIEPSAQSGSHEIVVGAGAGYKRGRYSVDNRTVLCVRGPLTCDMLGIDRLHAAIDPAILTSRFFTKSRTTGPAFMPHHHTHSTAGDALEAICGDIGIRYISPLDDAETIISQIAGSSCVIAEALHGAVVAESYGVPWVPVIFGSKVLESKWRDFAATIGNDYWPVDISRNIAFDGIVRPTNVMKYALARAGIGKAKYKYLPVKRATHSAIGLLQRDLFKLKHGPFVKPDKAVKAKSIEKLDTAICRFHEMYPGTRQ
ncbi:polysaccharide pyruvyl transferase family protein [Mesorhizobium sp. SP-1A]|uniref:polysaccharide pyruvyl transferase family protein n=1 Tax=Mesorhizobium sp. SP-1A TaxID=3077840 RepID=UPI0028F6E47E|nr:polysaccharide pyruvyl transferase family protein [Mesorhizobium sp. SP-1A]